MRLIWVRDTSERRVIDDPDSIALATKYNGGDVIVMRGPIAEEARWTAGRGDGLRMTE